MNVLYVNHTAEVSGGERSLLSVLSALPAGVNPRLAAPRGALLEAAARAGVPVSEIRGTAGSLRLHPLHTPKALSEMALAAAQLRGIARRYRADVLHANSIRAGIVVALAPRTGGVPLVHVRDVLPAGAVTTATLRLIAARARTILANSRYTAAAVSAAAPRASVRVLHSPVDLRRWDPALFDRDRARARLGPAGEHELLLGVVAQLSPWKGQHTAVQALRMVREQGLDAHLLLVGSAKFVARATRFDNEAYVRRLRAEIDAAGLGDAVTWLGEREDVPELVRALDVLLLPSEEEPFGRALAEAMAMGVPVLATDVGGPPEIVTDGTEGYLLAPARPEAWAQAIARLAASPQLRARMGAAGRERALSQFGLEHHVASLLDVYRDVTA